MIGEVYILSSLPSLTFGNLPPLSLEAFEAETKRELSGKNNELLDEISIRIPECTGSSALSKRVAAILMELQAEVAGLRQLDQEMKSQGGYLLPRDIMKENPLNREILMMKWLWEQLEDMVAGNTFTMTEVVAYKLKLQILHRLQSFNREEGRMVLSSILKTSEKPIVQ